MNDKDLTLLMPDSRWFDAPAERTGAFYAVFGPVARAIQATLRAKLSEILLADLDRFEGGQAYSLLVYSCTRTFRVKSNTDVCYDVLNSSHMEQLFRYAHRRLAVMLKQVSAKLEQSGRDKTAYSYRPSRARAIVEAVRKQKGRRRAMNQLVAIEGRLFQELASLATEARCPGKARFVRIAVFNKRWNGLLKQLYLRQDLSDLAPALLQSATAAYLEAMSELRNTSVSAPSGLAA